MHEFKEAVLLNATLLFFPVLPIPIRKTEYVPASSFREMLEEIHLTFLYFILHSLLEGRMAN